MRVQDPRARHPPLLEETPQLGFQTSLDPPPSPKPWDPEREAAGGREASSSLLRVQAEAGKETRIEGAWV